MRSFHRSSDRVLLAATVGLLLAGIAFVYSASAEFSALRVGAPDRFAINHSIRVALSLLVLLVVSRIDYHVLIQLSRPLLVLSVVLLLFVLVQGTQLKGAVRWLDIAGISFQPSEFAKFALLFHLAARIAQREYAEWDWKHGLLPSVGWIALVAGLIALQPNLSTAAVVFSLGMMLLFIGGARLHHLTFIASAGLVGLVIYALGAEYRIERLESYFGQSPTAESYQLQQALVGFAQGGIAGVGPGQSRQRDLFLPESYGDFIVAIVGEEYGFMGVVGLIMLYGIIVVRGVLIARNAPDVLGYLCAWAVVLVIGWYALINIAVSCGVLPTTGIPLPLVSYGGSSIVFTAAALGVLLNISRHTTAEEGHA
ncbi:MAG: putative peptidoglycan glycosyltransferase FtsW [Bacteroidota bacterium]|nr:putative peptidoglycan glycosyltransferase FtsW [Bacteroidota bacterium]